MQYKKVCKGKVRETFPGAVHKISHTLFDRLNEIGIGVFPEDKHYRFLLVLTLNLTLNISQLLRIQLYSTEQSL